MRRVAVLSVLALCAVSCGGSDAAVESVPPTTEAVSTTVELPATTDAPEKPEVTTTVQAAEPAEPVTSEVESETPAGLLDPADPVGVVNVLASDAFEGRNNQTDASAEVRSELVVALDGLAEPIVPSSDEGGGYFQAYDVGTNVVAVMPGRGALAVEYVLVGAHYDHLGPGECDVRDAVDDEICNGAADNAAGVAAVLSIAASIADDDQTSTDDRRSVVLGFWDGEEDGLVGSRFYVENPLIPLTDTVAYVNFDIQGAQLAPSLADTTIAVGAETGGQAFVDATRRATDASVLDYASLSLIFGQGRSDHANFVTAGVASVFFTDANNGCYHTVLDDVDHLDPDKLVDQIATATALVLDLSTTTTPPTFVADTPLSTFDDAVALVAIVEAAEPDLSILPGDGPAAAAQFLVDLRAIVAAGPDAYDDAAGGVLLSGAAALVTGLAEAECTIPV